MSFLTEEQINLLCVRFGKTREHMLAKLEEVRLQALADWPLLESGTDEGLARFRETPTGRWMGKALRDAQAVETIQIKGETVDRVMARIREINARRKETP